MKEEGQMMAPGYHHQQPLLLTNMWTVAHDRKTRQENEWKWDNIFAKEKVLVYGTKTWYASFYDKSGWHTSTITPWPPFSLFCMQHHFLSSKKISQVLCPGCDKPVILNILLRHLQNTQNECCHALLASILTAHTFFSTKNFLDLGANQRPHNEMNLPIHT